MRVLIDTNVLISAEINMSSASLMDLMYMKIPVCSFWSTRGFLLIGLNPSMPYPP